MKHECSGCPHWKWHKRDNLYGNPGYHSCDELDYCERFRMKKIKRDGYGFITDACLADMHGSLPIEIFLSYSKKPDRTIQSAEELERFLFYPLPYVCLTSYRHKEETNDEV